MSKSVLIIDDEPDILRVLAMSLRADGYDGAISFESVYHPGNGDFEAQVRQVCENLKNIVEEAGGTLQNIVKKTTFLTHYSYIETYRKVRNEYFPEPCPPNTLLIVESLALPEYMIEVEAIAVLD